ncbi:hypothetical protein BCR34DRAFT_71886 [Clohesyomyces aquaticus]|uniref:Uncharacterized protein n=1 Tax=Clohesyomyces aquaticus TaxID=1231657 RepID=A0A1Y1YZ61_9PLEO|nr:hypothetical protein BCR34DRAFT_71886 [Clohesyomyces aquaticus]
MRKHYDGFGPTCLRKRWKHHGSPRWLLLRTERAPMLFEATCTLKPATVRLETPNLMEIFDTSTDVVPDPPQHSVAYVGKLDILLTNLHSPPLRTAMLYGSTLFAICTALQPRCQLAISRLLSNHSCSTGNLSTNKLLFHHSNRDQVSKDVCFEVRTLPGQHGIRNNKLVTQILRFETSHIEQIIWALHASISSGQRRNVQVRGRCQGTILSLG